MLLLCAGALVLQAGPAAATSASFSTTSSWDSGYERRYTIANTGPAAITGRRVEFDLPASTTVGTFWDALMSRTGNHYTFTNRDYNATVAVGASVTFGFVSAGTTPPLTTTPPPPPPQSGVALEVAPHVDMGAFPTPAPADVARTTGLRGLSLAFVTSVGCRASWFNAFDPRQGFARADIDAVRELGGDVTTNVPQQPFEFTGIFRGFTGQRAPENRLPAGMIPPEHGRMSPENDRRASRPPTDPPPSPPAAGVRLPWPDLPEWLRQAIERDLGSPVVEATNQSGGFSPGTAARLVLADGGRAFVKAVGAEQNPDSPSMHRAEARVAAALPPAAPAPRLLASYDRDGWVALVYEDVEGIIPAEPWRPDELDRVLDAITDLAAALTPAPLDAPTAASRLERQFQGWRRTVAARSDGDPLDWLDPWARRNLDRLAELEAGWKPAVAGHTLVHGDLRADNLLLARDRVVVVDWPWACVGAPWLDLLLMLPSVRMQGGPDPEAVLAGHPVAAGADPHAMTSVLAAFAGMLTWQAHLPPPPGLPTLRAFQAAQAIVALGWLHLRTGWR